MGNHPAAEHSFHEIFNRFSAWRRRRALLATPFYRRYTWTNPVSIFQVDRRVFVSPSLRILFNGIGKAGHSSVVANLARVQSGQDIAINRAKGQTFRRPSSLSAQEVEALAGYFKFTLVRNPYTRTLSAYLDKVVRGSIVPERLSRRHKGRPPSFLDFCLYLEDGGLNDEVHWAPQTRMLVLPLERFDHVMKLEHFGEDFKVVLGKLGLSEGFTVARHDPHKTNSDRKRDEYYCDHSRAIVARLFEEDFRLLGYPRIVEPTVAEPAA